MKYKFLKHTADIKFRAYGKSLNELFENSVEALLKSMTSDEVVEKKKKKILAQGNDVESLLYNFLEELLILIDSENFLVSRANVQIDCENFDLSHSSKNQKFKLSTTLYGDDAGKYDVRTHVKAITYNEMFVKKVKNQFVCQVVVDV